LPHKILSHALLTGLSRDRLCGQAQSSENRDIFQVSL
jgi:hypothetical protein